MATATKTPALRFPGFKGEWEEKKLGEIAEKVNSGKTPLGGESVYTETGVLFIRSQNVTDNRLSLENATYISEEVNDTMKNSVVIPKDILLNITGASLGRSCVVPENFTTGNVNQHVCIIRLDKNHEPYFLQPIFASEKGQSLFQSLQTGSGREGLNFQSIRQIQLSFPTLPEQQKIAAFLTVVDERLQQLQQQAALLQQYKKGVMQQIFSRQLRFKDAKGRDFPDWEYKYGNEIFQSISNKDHDSSLPILAITQDQGAVPRDMIDYQISVTDKSIECYKVVEVGDYIISLRSFQGGIEYSNYKGICSPAYIILRPVLDVDRNFFKYYFKTPNYIADLNKKLEGIRDGKMVSYKYFSEIKLPFPSLPEQTRIAAFLSALDEKIAAVQAQAAHTQAWKKGLLQQLFC